MLQCGFPLLTNARVFGTDDLWSSTDNSVLVLFGSISVTSQTYLWTKRECAVHIQQPVEGIDREGEEEVLVVRSGQGIAYSEYSTRRICITRGLWNHCPIPPVASRSHCPLILGGINTCDWCSEVLSVQMVGIITETGCNGHGNNLSS